MASVSNLSKIPVVLMSSHSTTQEAVESMTARGTGAVVVMDNDKLAGIFSERDVVRRVLAKRKSPKTTKLGEVMTSPVETVLENTSTDDALRMMYKGQFRHLPILDSSGKPVGMVSIQDLLYNRVEELDMQNRDLAAYISADGPGG